MPRSALFALTSAGLVALAVAITTARYDDRALPGTEMAGVNVGGKTAEEVRLALTRPLSQPRTLRLVHDRSTIVLTATQAGASFDVAASADAAIAARPSGPLGTVRGSLKGIVAGRTVDPVAVIDKERQRKAIKTVASDIDRAVFSGRLRPDGSAVTLDPPRSGRRVRRNALADRLATALANPASRTLVIPVTVRRSVPLTKAQRVARQANVYLGERLAMTTGSGQRLSLTPAELAPLLALVPSADRRTARLGTDRDALAVAVARLATRVAKPPREPDLRVRGATPSVTGKGEVRWRPVKARVSLQRPGRPGRTLDERAAAKAIDAAVRAGSHAATLKVRTTKPQLTTTAARELSALIGTFTTQYEPGQPRVTNIQKMAREIDGTVVAVNETFSLNDAVGERTEAKGYVEAPFIGEGNRIEPSVGGGVSQFSTTMYNAAYFAGLRLDSHTPHSLYLDRYPAGRESTLNFPTIDLRWTNNTEAPILIATSYDATSITVRLYGDNGGRRVAAIPGDRQPLTGGGDFAITVTREVRTAGKPPVREPVTTRYTKPPPPEAE